MNVPCGLVVRIRRFLRHGPGSIAGMGMLFRIFDDFCFDDCIVDIQLQNLFSDGLVAQLVARLTPDPKVKCSNHFKVMTNTWNFLENVRYQIRNEFYI